MSFLKSLFGGGGKASEPKSAAPLAEEEYKGFVIKAVPMPSGSEHQLAGSVEKQIGGELKTHKFIRADKFGSRDEAASVAIMKGKQLVDEQGDRLFS